MSRRLVVITLGLLCATSSSAGCAGSPEPRATPEVPQVGVHISSDRTFATNAFWIEGPDGVLLIDTMFTPSAGVAALEAAEAATGARVTHAIVLHANPDKFNGTGLCRLGASRCSHRLRWRR